MDVMLSSSGDVFTLGGVEGKSGHVSLVEIMALAGRPRPLRYTACNGGSLFRPPGNQHRSPRFGSQSCACQSVEWPPQIDEYVCLRCGSCALIALFGVRR